MSQYTIPTVVEKTPTGERAFDIYSRLLSDRIVFLGTEIDDGVANVVMAQLLHLESASPEQEIGLYINSPGGSFSALTAIYDTMNLIPNDVSTLAMGLAGSMGQFLLSAGTPGKRFSLPHAQVLMHQGSAGFGGTAADVEIYAGQLERIGSLLTRLTAGQTGRSVETIEQDSLRDRWFTAEEARDYGLIDHIVERMDDVRPAFARIRAGL